jgi:hypothetical protein
MNKKFKVGDRVTVNKPVYSGTGTISAVNAHHYDVHTDMGFTIGQVAEDSMTSLADSNFTGKSTCDCGAHKAEQPGHSSWCSTNNEQPFATEFRLWTN